MAVSKIRVSELPQATSTNGLVVLGVQGNNQSVKADMELLRGNTGDSAFDLWIKQPENAGKTYQDYLNYNRQPATDAAKLADAATEAAKTAAQEAITATENADKATSTANTATDNAKNATQEAKTATSEAKTATQNAITATDAAKTATRDAITATENAYNATSNAETATGSAQNAADRLNSLSDHRDEIRNGFWWRWNEETGEYENTGEKAKGDVMFATFEVTEDGTLIMTTPDGYNGPVFSLEGSNLVVTI